MTLLVEDIRQVRYDAVVATAEAPIAHLSARLGPCDEDALACRYLRAVVRSSGRYILCETITENEKATTSGNLRSLLTTNSHRLCNNL